MGCKPMPLIYVFARGIVTRMGRDPSGARGLYPGLEPGPMVRSTKGRAPCLLAPWQTLEHREHREHAEITRAP